MRNAPPSRAVRTPERPVPSSPSAPPVQQPEAPRETIRPCAATEPTRLPAAVERAKKRAEMLRSILRELFVEGQDFVRVGDRLVLTKAGAETLLACFELVAVPAVTERMRLDEDALVSVDGVLRARHGLYEVRCTVTLQSHTGIVVSRASGSANSNESWCSGLSIWDSANSVLKMAEKRALVAATLLAVGGSAVFTQDLEDLCEEQRVALVTSPMPATVPAAQTSQTPQVASARPEVRTPSAAGRQFVPITQRTQPAQRQHFADLDAEIRAMREELRSLDQETLAALDREVQTEQALHRNLKEALEAARKKPPIRTMNPGNDWGDQ